MKIESLEAQIVKVPHEDPLAGRKIPPGRTNDFVIVTIRTSDGIEGIGLTFFGGILIRALKVAIEELGALIVGEDPLCTAGIAQKLKAQGSAMPGPGGIFALGQSAIDMALWDIKGKALNLPLAKLLGGVRDRMPAYASGALVRGSSTEEVATFAEKLVERGWTQMKTQLALPGKTSPELEVERIRVVRERIGPDITLMCDINQGWSVEQAISIGRRIEEFHLEWLEDVTAHDDYPGLARVTDHLATPIAGGEYVYGIVPFRHMIEARSIDVVMIDPCRVGGVTQFMKVAAMAEAFNLPVVSHLLPEINLHMMAAIPNGRVVEYMPSSYRLFENPPMPHQGELVVPAGPGFGLTFARDFIKRHAA
jgi:L-talarate/galactarate dehydratase